jgi:hypothetical protein
MALSRGEANDLQSAKLLHLFSIRDMHSLLRLRVFLRGNKVLALVRTLGYLSLCP